MSLPIKPRQRCLSWRIRALISILTLVTLFTGCYTEPSEQKSDHTDIQIQHIIDSCKTLQSLGEESSLELLLNDYGDIPITPIKEDKNSIEWLFLLGKEYVNRGDNVLATEYLEQARDLIEDIDSDYEFELLWALTESYGRCHEISKAEDCLTSLCYRLDPSYATDSVMFWAHFRVSRFYGSFVDNIDSCFLHAKKCLERSEQTNNKTLALIAKLHDLELKAHLGLLDNKLEALERLEELVQAITLPIDDELEFYARSQYIDKLAWSYSDAQQLEKSYETYLELIKLIHAWPKILDRRRSRYLACIHIYMAEIQYEMGNYTLSLEHLEKILEKSESVILSGIHLALSMKMDIYLDLGYPSDSIRSVFSTMAAEAERELSDKATKELLTIKENNNRTQALLQEKANLEQKQLSHQRDYAYLIIIFLALTLGFVYFYWRENKLRIQNENDLIKTKNRLLSGQLTPHFIHNSLHAVMLSIEDSDPTAYEYLSGLSKLLRHTFSAYQKDKVCLSDEINMLKKYVRLEQMRKGEGLISLNIDVHPTLNERRIFVTPMLIQPLLENAIKHSKPKELNSIIITIDPYKPNLLKCTIADTGVGIAEVMTQFPREHSLYYIDTHMTKLAKEKGLYMEPRHQGAGTRATLILEFSLKNIDSYRPY